MQELNQARQDAFQANPDLAAEGKALKEQEEAFHKKLEAAMIKADPKVEPILAKMKEGRPHHEGPDGSPPAQ